MPRSSARPTVLLISTLLAAAPVLRAQAVSPPDPALLARAEKILGRVPVIDGQASAFTWR